MSGELRKKLEAGESVFGVFSPYADVTVTELLTTSGLDFLIFDGEHGALSEESATALVLSCERRGCTPLIRVPSLAGRVIGRFLDFGMQGVVAPMINTAGELNELTQAMLYPPQGSRGFALTRHLDYGNGDNSVVQALSSNNESLMVIAQVETQQSLDNLDEILADERLDLVFVGPADLSISLGCPLDFNHPKFLEALLKVSAAAQKHQKHLGVLVNQPEQVGMLHSLGFRFFAGYVDSIISSACQDFAEQGATSISVGE